MADYFLQGFGSMLPDNHLARADLMQARHLGKEKHTGLVAYELTELAVDWLQELVGEEGGDKKLLDNLPAPNVDLEGRRRRILHVAVEFELGGLGSSVVMLTDGVDAFSQQYGFSTVTVTGLVLDTRRVGRKRTPLVTDNLESAEQLHSCDRVC